MAKLAQHDAAAGGTSSADGARPAEHGLPAREGRLLAKLRRYLTDRTERERQLRADYDRDKTESLTTHRGARRDLKSRIESEYSAAHEEFERLSTEAQHSFETRRDELTREQEQLRRRAEQEYDDAHTTRERQHANARWEQQTAHSAKKSGAKAQHLEAVRALDGQVQRVQQQKVRLSGILESRRMAGMRRPRSVPRSEIPVEDSRQRLDEQISDADNRLNKLEQLWLPKLVGPRLGLIFLGFFAILFMGTTQQWALGPAAVAAAIGSLVLGGLVAVVLYLAARQQVRRALVPIHQAWDEAEHLASVARGELDAAHRDRRLELRKENRQELRTLDQSHQEAMAEITEKRRSILRDCDERFPRLLAELTQERDETVRQLQMKYPPIFRQLKGEFDEGSQHLDTTSESELDALESRFQRHWTELVVWARDVHAEISAEIASIEQESNDLFPAWNSDCWPRRAHPDMPSRCTRFGQVPIDPKSWSPELPMDPQLRAYDVPPFSLPAFLEFPNRWSSLWLAPAERLPTAHQAMVNVMVRLLTSMPAGKVRFTIIDPVGLGQDFAAFMHLADYDEALVGSRIWTETSHIEQRLVDLTEHMENVIQKYLRNEFDSIDAYNEEAGEIAEPYRVLVIAQFPAKFSEAAIRRLVSIASAGVRCGVYVLGSVDTKAPMPAGITLADLERHVMTFRASGEGFRWWDPDLGAFPLTLDSPPTNDQLTSILSVAGERSKQAARVEVPFRVVAAPESEWWTGDSRKGVRVPLGRSGATKLQFLELGHGTSQHVLVAGKTGSGKSTLLHALITSAALRYAPTDVEFYLIDFKKGVEFKAYATHRLPNARVIAIESEREFGLSVMQRLDAELKERGERFRSLGVQDIAGYRDRRDADASLPAMPRILFVVDEFQEFFVTDDKIAQESSLLLDRLVRQGRAFGIHVLLGSQTLGGAYSLARSTLGQMAVRIALQCSESDAHLILSEENSSARLLSRPGEAIYNDANGRIEGNHPFQIVWLPDDEREDYLKRLQELSDRSEVPLGSQIVFEGNTPARLEENPVLSGLLSAGGSWSGRPTVWLGDAIEIKDPTSVEFTRQSGSNLVMLGQQEESALSLLSATLVGLSATRRDGGTPGEARVFLLDGSLADSPFHGRLAECAQRISLPIREVGRRELTDSLSDLTEILSARQLDEPTDAPDYFVVIHDLARWRDLRRSEDDFGFSSSSDNEVPRPDRMLQTLVKEGPALGIHVILWCDSYTNLQRTFDRQTIRDLGLRVLFQMSPTDSSTLVDTPVASRLGPYRALLHIEDAGRLEKFRPYGVPAGEWLEQLGGRLADRGSASTS